MIDFTFSPNDQNKIDRLKEQGLVARKYARYYDENESELPPDELPEAADFDSISIRDLIAASAEGDTGGAVMGMVGAIYRVWQRSELSTFRKCACGYPWFGRGG